jgi:hypothetical protein
MPRTDSACFACGDSRPTAALARLTDGRTIFTCPDCASVDEHRHLFVALYRATRVEGTRTASCVPMMPRELTRPSPALMD